LLSEVLSKLCPEILCDGSTYAELLTRLRLEYGISLGNYGFHVGQNPSANVAVCRLKKYITNILHGNDAQLIEKLPSLLRQFETLNPGCKTFVDATENGVFKRCAVITQRSIIYFQTDYVRKLFSIDCGFWKSGVGKEYKLLLIFGSTGNNTNLTVLWAIVDGETKDNIMWALDCLSEADIHTNNTNIAFLSDEGLGIVHGLEERAPLSAKFLCSKHWIGNHKGWGQRDALFWHLVQDCRSPEEHQNVLNALRDVNHKYYELYANFERPEKLFLYPRLLLQSQGLLPATYGRSMSFVEQGMKENVEVRSMHPLESFVAFTVAESQLFTRENDLANNTETVLTPFAVQELEKLSNEALRVQVTPIDTAALLSRTETQNSLRNHLTCWKSRSCTDCHRFAECHMPCKHLVAIWIHLEGYSNIVLECQDENFEWICTNNYYFVFRHLFGRCYWLSTMKEAHRCFPILPVSLANANVLPQDVMTLKIPPPRRGRPDKKRRASSMDSFATGTKKRFRTSRDAEKENAPTENSLTENSSVTIQGHSVGGKQSSIRLILQYPSEVSQSSNA
jgi:hypothetical protein